MAESRSESGYLKFIDHAIQKEFDANLRILSFDEYLTLFESQPTQQARGSAKYVADMMERFGKTPSDSPHTPARFKLFDLPVDGMAPKVVGQEFVQNSIFRGLKAFSLQGISNKLVLLHGPNGSAKSSIAHALMGGMERYSREKEGALYTFNWIFPVERYTKGGIGLDSSTAESRDSRGSSRGGASGKSKSFAKLADQEIAARVPCELRDHPLLIIPQEHRAQFLKEMLGSAKSAELLKQMPHYLTKGDLCHRCREIFDTLLTANGGDLSQVLAHVQVERFYFSQRYRKGLVTIEPQMHVDAQYHQLTYNRSMSMLPASLQSLNMFSLSGDLIDGNRGIIEYSDLLKRPVDSFKYLLNACESGSISVGTSIAYLDAVLLGSTNELQLDAFKEFPDFMSFKGRIETIRVPYLLSVSEEAEIYATQLSQIAGEKHIAPHTAWSTALWAVLTRMKKPNGINYPPQVSAIVSALTPLEKAKLYDTAELPGGLAPEDKKVLKASIHKLKEEYQNIPYYEGRLGASAREMKSILFDAAQNSEFPCLSPLAVLRELESFIKRVTEYEFLKQDVKEGYHDAVEFIQTVRNEYLNRVDLEVRDSIGLYESKQWEEFIKKYVQQISYVLKKEKVKNPITGKMENPDFALIDEFEKIVESPSEGAERDSFRQNIISQVGAWSLDHPNTPVSYAKVFPEFWRKLEKHYFESQKALLTKMHTALMAYSSENAETSSEGGALAHQTVKNMQTKLGYCEQCAKEVIIFLMKSRY